MGCLLRGAAVFLPSSRVAWLPCPGTLSVGIYSSGYPSL